MLHHPYSPDPPELSSGTGARGARGAIRNTPCSADAWQVRPRAPIASEACPGIEPGTTVAVDACAEPLTTGLAQVCQVCPKCVWSPSFFFFFFLLGRVGLPCLAGSTPLVVRNPDGCLLPGVEDLLRGGRVGSFFLVFTRWTPAGRLAAGLWWGVVAVEPFFFFFFGSLTKGRGFPAPCPSRRVAGRLVASRSPTNPPGFPGGLVSWTTPAGRQWPAW